MHHHLPETKKQGQERVFCSLKKGGEWKSVTIGFSLFILPDASLFWIFKTVVRVYCYLFIIGFYFEFINKARFVTLLASRQITLEEIELEFLVRFERSEERHEIIKLF